MLTHHRKSTKPTHPTLHCHHHLHLLHLIHLSHPIHHTHHRIHSHSRHSKCIRRLRSSNWPRGVRLSGSGRRIVHIGFIFLWLLSWCDFLGLVRLNNIVAGWRQTYLYGFLRDILRVLVVENEFDGFVALEAVILDAAGVDFGFLGGCLLLPIGGWRDILGRLWLDSL